MAEIRRFFTATPADDATHVRLDRDESHHLTRVLRLGAEAEIELLDGCGNCYRGRVESPGEQVLVRLTGRRPLEPPPGPELWVCQGDLKGKNMDLVVEKCTELGVTRFFPFASSRSQGRADGNRLRRRRDRWQTIVKSACKQSGRLHLMQVEQESFLADMVVRPEIAAVRRLLFWEEEISLRLADCDWTGTEPVCLMLGPEGGFSTAEVEAARRSGWQVVSLGSRVLRAETAAIAAVAVVQHLLGEV